MTFLLIPTAVQILTETVLQTRSIPMTIMAESLTAKMTSLKTQPKQMTLMVMVLVIIKILMMTMMGTVTVSYTHLTLPTILLV